MIIDSHVHVFPDAVRKQREHYCRLDQGFAAVYQHPKARLASAPEVLRALDDVGAHGAVVFGFPWGDPALCREHNDYVLEACRESPGRLLGLGCISPRSNEQALREAERCLQIGLAGIGEVATYDGDDADIDSPFFDELARMLSFRQRPLLIHATESVGHGYPGKDRTDLHGLYRWIEAHPDLRLVLAHWGGGLFFYELMPEVREACGNVYYDTSASPFLYDPKIYRLSLEIVGPDRIVFGSDFPLIHPRRYLREISEQALPAERIAGLLGENAARLWGWNRGPDRT
jgi:predicted TIM-barrel fold metal-dependent hydrolase